MKNDARTKQFLAYLSEHEVRLRGYVLSLVPSWNDAQEILQDVRVRLWEQFDDFDRKKDFGAWACTIAYFFVLAYRKQQSRSRLVFSEQLLETIAERSPAMSTQIEPRYHAVMDCLEKLPHERRDTILRYYAGENTRAELATAQKKSPEALRQIVLRIRRILAECITAKLKKGLPT